MSRSGNGDRISGCVLVVSINARDVRSSRDGSRTIRSIGDTSGNPDRRVPVTLDQAESLQHIVLVRITGHTRDLEFIGGCRAAGCRNNGS